MASAQLTILHPELFVPQDSDEFFLRKDTLQDENFQATWPTPPISITDLTTTGDQLLNHVQGLLDKYATEETRDLRIILVPVYANQDTERFGGMFGGWQEQPIAPDRIWMQWSGQPIKGLSVVTHEVGHHLRGRDEDAEKRFPVANALLHELTAEALVLAEHGENALHYQPGPIGVELVRLLKDEQLNPINEADMSIFRSLFKQDAVYIAAVTLLRMARLDISSVLTYTIPTFVPRALSHLATLQTSAMASVPES